MSDPLAYFITIRTYNTFLHGDPRGAVDRFHNQYDTPRLPADPERQEQSAERLKFPPLTFTREQRDLIDRTLRELCTFRHWHIHALNVRTNHFHIIVYAPAHSPERVMNDCKARATRLLREANLVDLDREIWEYHGSTPRIYEPDALLSAIDYVLNGQ